MIDFLLSYTTLAIAAVAFIADLVFLFIRRKKTAPTTKALLTMMLIVVVIYFVFVLWVVVASGNMHPLGDPIPTQ